MLAIAAATTIIRAQTVSLEVTAPPTLASAAERLRTMDQQTLVRSLTAADLPLPAQARVTLVEDADPRVRRIPSWVVGLASGTEQVLIFPQRIGAYPYGSLESVLRHELVHLSLNIRANDRPLPRWFHEGTAVKLEAGWSGGDELRLLLAALDPPSMADLSRLFASDSYPDTTQAYLLSGALVDEIVDRHGPEAIGRIAEGVGLGLPFEDAFTRATGESLDEAAARAWAGYRQLSRWVPVVASPSAAWLLILALACLAFVIQWRRRRAQRQRWDEEDEERMDEPDDDPVVH